MYPLTLGDTISVQQFVTGGTFDGTDRGRAGVLLAAFSGGTSQLRVRARRYGTSGNAYSIQLVDLGVGTAVTVTTALLVGSVVQVKLRRLSAGDPIATPDEVADAINSVSDYAFPVRAEIVGSGSPVAEEVASTPLTGGLDPEIPVEGKGKIFRWDLGSSNQGFFHFEQEEPLIIRSIEMKFNTPPTADALVEIINLTPAFSVRSGEGINQLVAPISASAPDLTVTDVRIPLFPGQALRVLFAAEGLVRVVARREARFPYL